MSIAYIYDDDRLLVIFITVIFEFIKEKYLNRKWPLSLPHVIASTNSIPKMCFVQIQFEGHDRNVNSYKNKEIKFAFKKAH